MSFPEPGQDLIMALGTVVGVVQCFFGYRVFKLVLALGGFLVGAALAGALWYEFTQAAVASVFAAVIGGVTGAALLVTLYFAGVFLIGAALGALVSAGIATAAGWPAHAGLLLIAAFLGGVLALVFQKFMIISSTAFSGAWAIVTGAAYFLAHAPNRTDAPWPPFAGGPPWLLLAAWIALGILGLIVQFACDATEGGSPSHQS